MRTTSIAGGILAAALSLSACGGQVASSSSAGTAVSGDAISVREVSTTRDVPGIPAQRPGDKVYDPYQDPATGSWWEVYAPLGENGGYLGEVDSINAVGEYLRLPDSAKRGPNRRAEVLDRFTCSDVRINETNELGFRCALHNSDLAVVAYPQAG